MRLYSQRTTPDAYIDFIDECFVKFYDRNCAIDWGVPKNNHAVEIAHQSFLAETLFPLLGTVKWTPRTGGRCWGNDEYNVDDYDDPAGSYDTLVLGCEVARRQKEQEERFKSKKSSMKMR